MAKDFGWPYVIQNGCMQNAFFGATPRHPILAETIRLGLQNVQQKYYGEASLSNGASVCVFGQAFRNWAQDLPMRIGTFKDGSYYFNGMVGPYKDGRAIRQKCIECGAGQDWSTGNNYDVLHVDRHYYCEHANAIFLPDDFTSKTSPPVSLSYEDILQNRSIDVRTITEHGIKPDTTDIGKNKVTTSNDQEITLASNNGTGIPKGSYHFPSLRGKSKDFRVRVLLFVTTHMSTQHIWHLKSCWPPALNNSLVLDTADVAVYLNPEQEENRKEAMDVLQQTFKNQNLTIHVRNNPGYPEESMVALTDATQEGWFKGYDWVIRVNPDVIIRDDTFVLDVMKNDPKASGLLINCFTSSKTRPLIHTDFFAVKPEALSPTAFLHPLSSKVERAFTRDIRKILDMGGARWIPGAQPITAVCRAGYGRNITDTHVIHFHPEEEMMSELTCPIPFSKTVADIDGTPVISHQPSPTKEIAKQNMSTKVQGGNITHNKPVVAILLFGVPKEFNVIWDAYQQNIIQQNPHVFFCVSMHMYQDVKKLTNDKNREVGVAIESVDTIHSVLHKCDPSGPSSLSSPPGHSSCPKVTLHLTNQEDFDKTLQWIKPKHTGSFDPCCWSVDTLKNMFRQGNSIQEAYWSSINNTECKPDTFIFARSDTLLTSPISIPETGQLPPNQLWVPSWQVWPDFEYVDRFAVAGLNTAKAYASAKAQVFKRYIQEYNGPPNHDHEAALRNSEKMLKKWLDSDENEQIKVKCQPKDWAKLTRVRAGGVLDRRDASDFGVPLDFVKRHNKHQIGLREHPVSRKRHIGRND